LTKSTEIQRIAQQTIQRAAVSRPLHIIVEAVEKLKMRSIENQLLMP